MVTQAALDRSVKTRKWWNEREGDKYTLNCSSPWDTPTDRDPDAGEICHAWVENGELHWTWQWDAGYDEHYAFETLREFHRFYTALLNHGISGMSVDDYKHRVC